MKLCNHVKVVRRGENRKMNVSAKLPKHCALFLVDSD